MTEEFSKTPHNDYFIRSFNHLELAKSFLREYLPQSVEQLIDWRTFREAPRDFVQLALKDRQSDVLYLTRLGKGMAYFYLHLEHQFLV